MRSFSRQQALALFGGLPFVVAVMASKPKRNDRLAEVEAQVAELGEFDTKVVKAAMAERASAAWQQCASLIVVSTYPEEIEMAVAEAIYQTFEAVDALEV